VASAPGCTLFDSVLPGSPFTPDQPKAEVTVDGDIHVDVSTGGDCPAGRTLLWGTARNSGDVDVDDVYITIEALDGNRNVLGSSRVHVFNGVVSGGTTPEEPIQTAGTSLTVDQAGTFAACSGVPAGAIAATSYRTDFLVISELPTK
jgi:hypothetical protein